MSVETYYNVLGIPETATQAEIKAAYRNLIKQVHPDTLAALPPYLRRIAEDKTKEMTEAYSVLSDASKRRQYDRLLAEHRQQSAPPPAPSPPPRAAPQPSSGPYCCICGTTLYASGFCPTCGKFATAVSAPPPQPPAAKQGNNRDLFKDWAAPVLAGCLVARYLCLYCRLSGDSKSPTPSQSKAVVATDNAPVSSGPISAFPCDRSESVSPIDGKPCKAKDVAPVVVPTGGGDAIAGTYIGTVHNQTVGLTSSFTTVLYQKNAAVLDGCMDVKPPLYGSGAVHGNIRGSHLDFVVADIRFQGVSLKNEITGSYVVSRQDGQQLGDFRLAKQPAGAEAQYGCFHGTLTEVETATKVAIIDFQPEHVEKPRPKPVAVYAIVGPYYTSLYKRCAFLPKDNYGRCNYQPQTVAQLKKGDRVKVLSPQVRAEDGDDIYKVRTQQGWEGWIDSRGITMEPQ